MKPFFDFAGNSALGQGIVNSRYAFPIMEMVHLLGLALLLGAVLLFNARFFGLGLRRQSVAEVAEDLAPWIKLALAVMVASGVPLFAAKALDLWREDLATYTTKMSLIVAGVVFHYAVQVPLARKQQPGRAAAAVALVLWFGAAVAGLSLEFI